MTATPPGWDATLWRQNNQENRRSILELIEYQTPKQQFIASNNDSEDNSINANRITDINVEGNLYNDENNHQSINSVISTNDTDHNQNVIRGNLAAELGPHQITLNTLLNDPGILTNIIFQPIHQLLKTLKEEANRRNYQNSYILFACKSFKNVQYTKDMQRAPKDAIIWHEFETIHAGKCEFLFNHLQIQ
jgi:hypothetical protein